MTMCTPVWFNCGVVCSPEKKKFVNANPISDKLKLKILQKIYEKNCYGPQVITGTLSVDN